MKKLIIVGAILVLAGMTAWRIYELVSEAPVGEIRPTDKAAVAVELRPVETGTIRDVGAFTGTVHPRSQFVAAPKISGRLEKLPVDVGDRITPGQLVAVLDRGEYVQQVQQAKAELEVAEAQLEESLSALEIADRELQRVKALRQKRIAAEAELDAAEAEFKAQSAKQRVAKAQVLQKMAALEAAEVRLSYTRINAGGEAGEGRMWVVGERFVDEGTMLSPGEAIVSILDIGTVTAVIHVIEKDYPKVVLGQKAVVKAEAFPSRAFEGEVVRVAPLLKEASRQARVEIVVPNTGGELKPGMFVRAEIEFEKKPGVTMIPLNAVVKREGKEGVFVADTNKMKARFVPVTLGITYGDRAEVLEPALSGSVVTLGRHLLEDGAPILPPENKGPSLEAPRTEQ
ncbi:MAG: efflux RND transporter periplasmic adaptor subunit [Desulfobacteraceae bacterium]